MPARQLIGKCAGLPGRTAHEQLHPAGKDDGVIGAAHGGHEIRMRRGERGRPDAVENARQRKLERVRLVQRHFENPGDDLHGAGEALGRRVKESQLMRRKPAGGRHLVDNRRRRRSAALEQQRPGRGGVLIGNIGEQRLGARQRPRGP